MTINKPAASLVVVLCLSHNAAVCKRISGHLGAAETISAHNRHIVELVGQT